MNWLWIPAVVLLGLFVLVLCWLFFSEYTCCPCRRKRNRETVLPTHADHATAFLPSAPLPPSQYYQPSAPQFHAITPSDSPQLHLKYADVPLRQLVRLEKGVLTLDLHNATVREATQIASAFIANNIGQHSHVRIITGRGLHSDDGIPKVKPAIFTLLKNQNLKFIETNNGGCFDVVLPR